MSEDHLAASLATFEAHLTERLEVLEQELSLLESLTADQQANQQALSLALKRLEARLVYVETALFSLSPIQSRRH